MPRTVKYHCQNCGYEFQVEVMDREEADRKRVGLAPVQCEKCNRTDLREGWG